MQAESKKFDFVVSSNVDFEDLVAEIDYGDEFLCILDQDKGFEDIEIHIFPRKNGAEWNLPMDSFLRILDKAKDRLWELRKDE